MGWDIWFGLTTLTIWQNCNEKVFQSATGTSIEIYHRVRTQAMGVRSILASMSSSWTVLDHQYDRQTKWEVPLDGWVKLNCDAAVTNLGANAAVGGVVRNANGNFLLGFAMDIGEATVTMAELKAILTSLNVLRGKGYSKIVINSDSLTVVRFVQGGCSNLHPCYQMVKGIRGVMRRINECAISHTLHEANQVVDSFAKFSLTLTMCSRIFYCVPNFASLPLHADPIGSVFPRVF